MTIYEYFETIAEEDRDELMETLYAISQDDPEDFESYMIENGVDLTAVDPRTGEYYTILWGWDMCGD